MDDLMDLPPLTHPGFQLYADRGEELIKSMIAIIVLTTSFVFLRLLSRKVTNAGFWWDDVLVVVALLLSLVNPALNIVAVNHTGFGKHIARFGSDAKRYTIHSAKIIFVFQIFFALSTGIIKLCILVFYRRILPAQQLRRALYTMSGIVIAFTIAVVFLTIFQCTPVPRFWNRSLLGSCADVYRILMVSGSINTALDFIVVLLPVPLLWQLRTSTRQKCLLTGVFLTAGFVCVVSILRLAVYSRKHTGDITWHAVNVTLWSAVEPCAGVISACIPSLRPLIATTLRAVHIRLPTYHRCPSSIGRRPESGSSTMPWIIEAKERANADVEEQHPQNTLQTVSSAMQKAHSRKLNARLGQEFRVAETEVPYGAINVKTEIRWSVQDRYDYDNRVY